LGADALGFVFYPKSKRYLEPTQAGQLAALVPAFVSTVALFVEPEERLVREVISAMHPTYLQFHGDEPLSDCERFEWPYIKAFRVGAPGLDTPEGLAQACLKYPTAKAWLFDSYTPSYGGSGHGFDRHLLSQVPDTVPMILSGGLKADNVVSLLAQTQPWAVDVSSGVEVAPGVKSADLMAAFVQTIHQADARAFEL
jgi:phosphoribosylanthranilate isomerase